MTILLPYPYPFIVCSEQNFQDAASTLLSFSSEFFLTSNVLSEVSPKKRVLSSSKYSIGPGVSVGFPFRSYSSRLIEGFNWLHKQRCVKHGVYFMAVNLYTPTFAD